MDTAADSLSLRLQFLVAAGARDALEDVIELVERLENTIASKAAERVRACSGWDWRPGADVFLILSPRGHILECSRTLEFYTGRPMSDILGQPVWEFVPPENAERSREIFMSAVGVGRDLEFCAATDRGEIEVSVHPHVESGRVAFVVVIVRMLKIELVGVRAWQYERAGAVVIE